MPVRIIISLFSALEAIALSIIVLTSGDGTISRQFLVGKEKAYDQRDEQYY
jgi:hypothetical protein